MIKCKELNREFKTKKELFKALKDNKDEIIAFKKSQIQKSCDKGLSITAKVLDISKVIDINKALKMDDDHYYIVVNSTKILDSHDDLHLNGIWDVTAKAQNRKNYLLADHKMEMDKVVAKKENVEIMVAEIPFSMIGKSYDGNTEALIYKVAKNKVINETAKEWLDSGDDIEASVRMQYVKIKLALDSDDKHDKEEKNEFDKHFDKIANKEEFDEINYFWPVYEAKNINESSLVIFGSNNATGPIPNAKEVAEQALQNEKAAEQALSESKKQFYKHLN